MPKFLRKLAAVLEHSARQGDQICAYLEGAFLTFGEFSSEQLRLAAMSVAMASSMGLVDAMIRYRETMALMQACDDVRGGLMHTITVQLLRRSSDMLRACLVE